MDGFGSGKPSKGWKNIGKTRYPAEGLFPKKSAKSTALAKKIDISKAFPGESRIDKLKKHVGSQSGKNLMGMSKSLRRKGM